MKIIAGNWKMNGSRIALDNMIDTISHVAGDDTQVMLFVPYTMLRPGNATVMIGAQNVSKFTKGAYTGDVSAAMVRATGAVATLVGHSEARNALHDTNLDVAERAGRAIKNKLLPVICVGETIIERDAGIGRDVVAWGVRESVPKHAKNGEFIIAYEPRWAIGRGITPAMSDITDMHKIIRDTLIDMGFNDIPILYGASVTAQNVRKIINLENVDGVLVGGASLKKQDFIPIIENTK